MLEKARSRLLLAIFVVGCAMSAGPVSADVINGNFSSGNTGFTNPGYTYEPSGDQGGGGYTVGTNPHSWNSALFSFTDHTTGSPGLMLIADGIGNSTTAVWSEATVSVTPNTQYQWTFYGASAGNDDSTGKDESPATFVAKENGVQIGSTLDLPAADGVWTEFTGTFMSGSGSTVSLSITDSNPNGGNGNDFAIDDISITPEPGTSALALCAASILTLRRRRRAT